MNICTNENRLTNTENRHVVAKVGAVEAGRIESLGLAGAKCYT